jgi:hypothetical protein
VVSHPKSGAARLFRETVRVEVEQSYGAMPDFTADSSSCAALLMFDSAPFTEASFWAVLDCLAECSIALMA